jgi:hypothetical protein
MNAMSPRPHLAPNLKLPLEPARAQAGIRVASALRAGAVNQGPTQTLPTPPPPPPPPPITWGWVVGGVTATDNWSGQH